MLRQAFKIGIGNKFCNVTMYTLYTKYLAHMRLLILLCPHQPRCCPLNFFMWDLRSILPIYPLLRLSYCHSFWCFSLYFFPQSSCSIFFQIDLLSIFVSLHITSTFKFFLFLLFFSCQKFLFSKNVQETQRCKVWLDIITSHFIISYSESLNVGGYLPVCTVKHYK